MLALASWIAERDGASCGYLVKRQQRRWQTGGRRAQARGLNAGQMLTRPMKALLMLNTEPVLDAADAAAARKALAGSGLVVR
jgi:NADH-quinone oxidoreductase subunit G